MFVGFVNFCILEGGKAATALRKYDTLTASSAIH